jgi:hypothetical protein
LAVSAVSSLTPKVVILKPTAHRRQNYATDNPILLIVEQTSTQRRYRAYGFVVKPKRAHNELRVEPMP